MAGGLPKFSDPSSDKTLVEGVLTAHAEIVDAAVIAKPWDNDTELPKAFVVLREGSKLSEQDVQAHMKERLAGYKQLTGGVQFMEAIPKVSFASVSCISSC